MGWGGGVHAQGWLKYMDSHGQPCTCTARRLGQQPCLRGWGGAPGCGAPARPCSRLLQPGTPVHTSCCTPRPLRPPLPQWFALTREHVELILADTEVDGALRAHCRTMWEPERGEERECYSGGLSRGKELILCKGWSLMRRAVQLRAAWCVRHERTWLEWRHRVCKLQVHRPAANHASALPRTQTSTHSQPCWPCMGGTMKPTARAGSRVRACLLSFHPSPFSQRCTLSGAHGLQLQALPPLAGAAASAGSNTLRLLCCAACLQTQTGHAWTAFRRTHTNMSQVRPAFITCPHIVVEPPHGLKNYITQDCPADCSCNTALVPNPTHLTPPCAPTACATQRS